MVHERAYAAIKGRDSTARGWPNDDAREGQTSKELPLRQNYFSTKTRIYLVVCPINILVTQVWRDNNTYESLIVIRIMNTHSDTHSDTHSEYVIFVQHICK